MEALTPTFRAEHGEIYPFLAEPRWSWKAEAPGRAIVAYVPGANGSSIPVACLRLFLRTLVAPGRISFRAYGVGWVYTAEEWRGRGLASLLLQEADGFAREHGAAFLALHARLPANLYGRAGYVPVCVAPYGFDPPQWVHVRCVWPGLKPDLGTWRLYPEVRF